MIEGIIAIALFSAGQLIYALIWGSAITVKVDTLWQLLLRRGIVEAVQKELGGVNSPFKLTEATEILMWSLPLMLDIKRMTNHLSKNISEVDLAFKIEEKFGDRMVRELCIPEKISCGACLVVALEIARAERRKRDIGHDPERRNVS